MGRNRWLQMSSIAKVLAAHVQVTTWIPEGNPCDVFPKFTSIQNLRLWPYLEIGSLQMELGKLRWGHTGPKSKCLYKKRRGCRGTQRADKVKMGHHLEQCPMNQEHQGLWGMPRWGGDTPPSPHAFRETWGCWDFDAGLAASRTVGQQNSVVLSCPTCRIDSLLQQP